MTGKKYKVLARDTCAPFIHGAAYSYATSNLTKDVIGMNSEMLFENIGLDCRWCLDLDSFVAAGKATLAKLQDKIFFEQVKQKSTESINKLSTNAAQLSKQNLSTLTNSQLGNRYEELFEIWIEMNVWGQLVNLVDFEHFMLSNSIMEFLKRKTPNATEAFVVLLTPNKRSKLQQQDLDLYALLTVYKTDKSALQRHVEKYKWLQFHYDGPTVLGEDYFLQILRGLEKEGIIGREKIAEILKHEKEVKTRQKELSLQLKLSPQALHLIEIGKEFAYLKALRKEAVFEACCNSFPLIREIAKRLNLSITQVKFMTIEEVKNALETGEINLAEINNRMKHCVTISTGKVRLFSGKAADQLAQGIYEEKADASISHITGMPAFSGKVVGTVKIILAASDMKKFNRSDVLVSPATNPNLLQIMKIAGAIVTDEGGVTCHAAIVSRELKKPCIIGTKVATKWLKDGDKVEVDAVKGVVKKL